MTQDDIDRSILAMREHLHGVGVPADDLDETGVVSAMLPELCMAVAELGRCTLLPGSWDKRFVRNMQGIEKFTVRQAVTVFRLRHKYRRQTRPGPAAFLLAPLDMPRA